MPRNPLEPSRLSKILQHLQKEPRPYLPAVQSLKLTYALRNDHFGARHFVKEDLCRIAYSNPSLAVTVNKIPKKPEDVLVPEMEVTFRNGESKAINMDNKQSGTILQELLDLHSQVAADVKLKPSGSNESSKSSRQQQSPKIKI